MKYGSNITAITPFRTEHYAKKFITPLFDGILTSIASGFVIAIFALVLAIPFAAYTSKPLRRVFVTHEAIEKPDLIGP
jgi:ABC-type spermidine/putrescine transport system permease subunit I